MEIEKSQEKEGEKKKMEIENNNNETEAPKDIQKDGNNTGNNGKPKDENNNKENTNVEKSNQTDKSNDENKTSDDIKNSSDTKISNNTKTEDNNKNPDDSKAQSDDQKNKEDINNEADNRPKKMNPFPLFTADKDKDLYLNIFNFLYHGVKNGKRIWPDYIDRINDKNVRDREKIDFNRKIGLIRDSRARLIFMAQNKEKKGDIKQIKSDKIDIQDKYSIGRSRSIPPKFKKLGKKRGVE